HVPALAVVDAGIGVAVGAVPDDVGATGAARLDPGEDAGVRAARRLAHLHRLAPLRPARGGAGPGNEGLRLGDVARARHPGHPEVAPLVDRRDDEVGDVAAVVGDVLGDGDQLRGVTARRVEEGEVAAGVGDADVEHDVAGGLRRAADVVGLEDVAGLLV